MGRRPARRGGTALRRTAWIGIALSILVGLPAIGLVAAAASIDPNRAKPRIAALVEAQTGRALSLNGPIRMEWSLRPTLSIADARLANLPGGSRPDMARVERIEARLSIPALLHHRIEISRLTLIGPNILLEQVAGRPNWVFQPQDRPRPGTPGPATGDKGGFALAILAAHVQNGMVTFHFPARTSVIGLRSLDYAHRRWTDKLTLGGVLVYADFQPFTLHVSATPTGGTFDPWTTILQATAFDASLAATGSMSLDGPFALSVAMRAPALERLNQLLPEMRLPALHRMELSARIRNGPERGDLPIAGQSTLRFDSADLGDRVPGLSLSGVALALPKEGGVATASGAGRYLTQGFGFNATLAVPVLLDGRSLEPLALDLHTDGKDQDTLSLRGTLALADAGYAGFDGAMTLKAKNLAAFRPIASPALPALTNLSLRAGLSLPAASDRVVLRGLALSAREGDLSGDASVRLGGAKSVSGALRSTRLDLDALLPAPDPSPRPAAGGVFPNRPLPWDMLRGPALDLSWRADIVRYRGQDWPDLRVAARLDQGRLALSLPGGLLQGDLTVDAGQRRDVPVRLAVRTTTLALAPVAGLAGVPGRVDGTLSLSLQLAGKGDTPHALAASLDGSLSLSTLGASIGDQALTALAGPALKQLGAPPPAGGRATIRCLGVDGTLQDGVVRLRTIALDAGALILSGSGMIDLGKETVALKLHPLARLAGSRVAVPVVVTGGFSSLHAGLDASGLDKVGLLIDALFGGDHPKTCAAAGLAPAPG